MDREEREFNDPKGRLKEHKNVRIPENKEIEEIEQIKYQLRVTDGKLNKIIQMLIGHDRDMKKIHGVNTFFDNKQKK